MNIELKFKISVMIPKNGNMRVIMLVLRFDLVDLAYSWKEIEMFNAKKYECYKGGTLTFRYGHGSVAK